MIEILDIISGYGGMEMSPKCRTSVIEADLLLVHFSLFVHKGCLSPHSFHSRKLTRYRRNVCLAQLRFLCSWLNDRSTLDMPYSGIGVLMPRHIVHYFNRLSPLKLRDMLIDLPFILFLLMVTWYITL